MSAQHLALLHVIHKLVKESRSTFDMLSQFNIEICEITTFTHATPL